MEITKRYQQTEVGLMPKDWEIKQLRDVTDTITCGVAATPKYVDESVGRPFLSAQNVRNGKVVAENLKYISIDLYNQITKHNKPKQGDILYTRVGAGIGEAGVIETDFDFAIYVSLTLIKPKRDLNSYYLKFLLNSNQYRFLAKRDQFAGGGVQNLNVQVVREFPIPIPTFAEQTAIATALSDADTLIQTLEKLIVKKRSIKQGAMQELLKPKKNWVTKKLGEVASLKARIGWQGLTTAEYKKSGDYFLITGTDFNNGFIDWENCFYVEEERYKQDRNIQVKENDVLVTKDGTIGKVAFIKNVPKPATLNSGVFVIRPIEQSFHQEFFYYLLLTETFKRFLSQLSAGSTINHLYQKDFVNFQFQVPDSIEEQIAIAKIFSDMDADIAVLENKLTKYTQIKQGMMQNLLTGSIRLV